MIALLASYLSVNIIEYSEYTSEIKSMLDNKCKNIGSIDVVKDLQ